MTAKDKAIKIIDVNIIKKIDIKKSRRTFY